MIWTTRLDRYVMGVGTRQLLFSLAVLTLVLVAGLIAPLIGSGANWLDVLLYLPQQIALPMTITLPVAMMSATALCMAGMYESRELIALASVGISHRRVIIGLLPMALITALVTGWLAHVALPNALKAFREARTELVSQALAVRVARQQPVIERPGGGVLVMACDETKVFDVIAHQQDKDGGLTIAFAPSGLMFSRDDIQGKRFDFNLHNLRALRIEGTGDEARLTAIRLPQASSALVLPERRSLPPPDVLSTRQLGLTIPWLRAVVEDLETAPDEPFWPHMLETFQPQPGSAELVTMRDADVAKEYGRAFVELVDAGQKEGLQTITRSALSGRDFRASLLLDWSGFCGAGISTHEFCARFRHSMLRDLRKMELNWHMRWVLACSPLTLWLLGCGIGLRLNLNNHTLVPMLAIGCMMLAVGPGIAMVDGLRHRLPMSPAWILWPVQGLFFSLGTWWTRRLQ